MTDIPITDETPQPDANGWFSIDSAPKGADLLLYGPAVIWQGSMEFMTLGQGGWDPDEKRWMLCMYDDSGKTIYFDPSHWQPLPNSPESAK